jgi:hypothetical protein
MLCVGVDAHKAHSQVTVIDDTGTVLERRRAASSPEGGCSRHSAVIGTSR